MRILFSIAALLFFALHALGQAGEVSPHLVFARASANVVPNRPMPHFLYGDRQWSYRMRTPLFMSVPATAASQNDSYWLSTMTSQSYNSGKLGTFYYWDVSGNLCESRTYLDIAGKHKRGLKLVFRRR